jgi:integrase
MNGEDPAGERQRARRSPTLAELSQSYLERYARLHKRTWKDDAQRIRDFLIPAWGTRKAESIRRADVSALHRKVGESRGHYSANRTLALVSHMFGWAEREGLLPEGNPNPARGVARFRERSRERWLSPAEIREVAAAIEAESNVYVQAYFWLSLLTGCRKRELLFARWADVDLQREVLKLPETKNGRSHECPWLVVHARSCPRSVPKRATPSCSSGGSRARRFPSRRSTRRGGVSAWLLVRPTHGSTISAGPLGAGSRNRACRCI